MKRLSYLSRWKPNKLQIQFILVRIYFDGSCQSGLNTKALPNKLKTFHRAQNILVGHPRRPRIHTNDCGIWHAEIYLWNGHDLSPEDPPYSASPRHFSFLVAC